MKKAIGGAYVYNLVIIFLLIMFAFLMGAYSYSKAYRVSKGVTNIIQNYSGYSQASPKTSVEKEIDRYLSTIGYGSYGITKSSCPKQKVRDSNTGNIKEIAASWAQSGLCIYEVDKITEDGKTLYITYGVVSYMSIDLPIVRSLKIPIYGETEKIYVFN